MKHKRVWTDEQRQAASDRMRKMSTDRWAKKAAEQSSVAVEEKPVVREVAPEVQAVIDSMDPIRKAKLAMIQGRTLATAEAQEALKRHEAEKPLPPSRTGSREVS